MVGKRLDKLEVPHQEVTLYAAKVLATKREAEIRLERQEGGGNERKETWKRKELALKGVDEATIETVIQRRRQRNKGEGNELGKRSSRRSSSLIQNTVC